MNCLSLFHVAAHMRGELKYSCSFLVATQTGYIKKVEYTYVQKVLGLLRNFEDYLNPMRLKVF